MNNIATVVVDYQNGFANKKTNELYVHGGEDIAPEINSIMQRTKDVGGIVIASKDEHPIGNISFASNFVGKLPITVVGPSDSRAWITIEEVRSWKSIGEGLISKAGFTREELIAYLSTLGGKAILWPDHCQKNTEGAEFYDEFDASLVDITIIKGDKAVDHPYSAFPGVEPLSGQSLDKILENAGVSEIDIVGLATDYCVKDTILDLARTKKYQIRALLQGMRAVSGDTEALALKEFRDMGVIILP